MLSSSLFSIFTAATLFSLSHAAPVKQNSMDVKRGTNAYWSECVLPSSGLSWSGSCSRDPCTNGDQWCVDFYENTYNPKVWPLPPAIEPKLWFCQASGFDGACSYDPCDGQANSWCNDYHWKTYTPISQPLPAPQPQVWYCQASGFNGACSYDPCDGQVNSWCTDYHWKTYTPISQPLPETPTPTPTPTPAPEDQCVLQEQRLVPNAGNTCQYNMGINFYSCQNNSFKGCCSSDPCASDWCLDYKPGCYNHH